MKLVISISTALLFAGSLFAADPKEEVQAAAKALAEKENYSWTTKSSIEGGERSFDVVITGMSERDSFTHVTIPRNENTIEIVSKGDKRAVKTQDGWRTLSELESDTESQGRRGMMRMLREFKAPAAQAEELAGKVKELKKTDDGYSGELTDEAAKELLTFGRGAGGNAQVSNAKGKVTFQIDDGALTRYSYEVQGTVTADNNERNVTRKWDVEIRDVGTTKVVVPDEARIKAS